jgi:hypothetical protein
VTRMLNEPGSNEWRLDHLADGDNLLKIADQLMVTSPHGEQTLEQNLRVAEVLTRLAAAHYRAASAMK